MMDAEETAPRGLTWETLKQIFPVALSLRREHWDLLSGIGIAAAQKSDDGLFYEALLHKFRNDAGFIAEFDSRFLKSRKKKDEGKSFLIRAHRWLCKKIPDLQDYDDLRDAPGSLFEKHAVEREVRDMLLALVRVSEASEASSAAGIEERWRKAAAEMRGLLEGVVHPTPEAVDRTMAAAQALLDAGREYGKLAEAAARDRGVIRAALEPISERRPAAEILQRLDALGANRLPGLARQASRVQEHSAAAAALQEALAGKTADFDRLRSEGASWAAIADRANALADLEGEGERREKALSEALDRMAAAAALREEAAGEGPAPLEDARAGKGRRVSGGRSADDEPEPAEPPDGAALQVDEIEPDLPLPAAWAAFPAWCAQHLGDRLVLSSRARSAVRKAQYEDTATAARCLCWLAGEYRRARLNGAGDALQGPIDSGFRNERCGGDSFDFDWHGQRIRVEWHVKNGGNTRDPARCLRVYYFWDEKRRQVVVADMPGHVRSRIT